MIHNSKPTHWRMRAGTLCLATAIASAAAFAASPPAMAATAGHAGTSPSAVTHHAARIDLDPRVAEAIAKGENPPVIVRFKGDNNLDAAFDIKDGDARAIFVHQTLTATAEQAQARTLNTLRSQFSLSEESRDFSVLWIINGIAVSALTPALLTELQQDPNVSVISLDDVIEPMEPAPEFAPDDISPMAAEASIARVKAPEAWANGWRGQGLVIANIDDGVRHTHNALRNQYRGNTGSGYDHQYNWFDPYSNPPQANAPRTTGSHGTHVMGTMVGDDGSANQIGVAPDAQWIACLGFGASGGSATDTGLVQCGQFMLAPTNTAGDASSADPTKRPAAVNNSWGNCQRSYDSWYEDVVDAWIAAGIVPIFANGNASNCGYSSNPPLNTVGNPARLGKAMGIGSTGNSNGQYAGHSNKGPTDNPTPGLPNYPDHFGFADLKPNLVAPGVSIRSSTAGSDNSYQSAGFTGTSMSAPAVTGAVAVILSAAECLQGDYATMGSILMQTANRIAHNTGSPSDGPGSIPNQATGWGELDVLAAATAARSHCLASALPSASKVFEPETISSAESSDLTITVTNNRDEPATLTADFSDELPAGLTVVGTATTDCDGTVSNTATTITLATGTVLASESSCTITAEIAPDAPGVFTNVIAAGELQTDLGDNPAEATATLTAYDGSFPNPPTVTKSFTPSTIFADETSVATVTLTNTAPVPAVLTAAFTDDLPAGLIVDNAETTCGLSVGTDFSLNASVSLPAGVVLAPNSSCDLIITVSPTAAGSFVNTIPMLALETDQGSNLTDASATLTVNAGFPAPYCDISFPSSVEPITLVDFAGINNRSSATGGPALEDFRNIVGTVSQGGLYTMAVEGNTDGSYTNYIRVFIDWNQDGSFDASESYTIGTIAGSTGQDGIQAISDIVVPAGALLGETRMRVTKRFSAAAEPCNTSGFGQAEDYTLVINDEPVPDPIADVTPNALHLEAEAGGTDSAVLTVHNDGPGRLEFNITRALAERSPPTSHGVQMARSTFMPLSVVDLDKLAILEQSGHGLTAYDRATSLIEEGVMPGAASLYADDPGCDIFTPGIIVHDHDGIPDNGYGFNPAAGTDARLVDKFTPTAYPNSFSTVCIAFLTNTGLTSAAVEIVVFDDDGPGGSPGTELGSVSAVADNIASGLAKQFQSFDVSSMGLDIASGSVYIGVRWDATAQEGFFIGSDESSAVSAGGYAYSAGEWDPASALWADYRALFIRAVESDPVEPGVGCESPSNVPWLTVNPASGAINGVGTMDVTVTANAASLDMGTHEGWICIETNDAARPLFEVPVTFEVGASDIIFQDGFEGVPDNPDIVTGVIDALVNADEDGSTLDLVTGQWGSYNPSRADDINLYDWGDGTMAVYWYGDLTGLSVGGVTTGEAGVFAILQSGDTIGPASPISAASAQMTNWNAGTDGYLGIAFENEETGELNYGYIHLTTAGPNGFPARVIEYAYNKAGDAIIIP